MYALLQLSLIARNICVSNNLVKKKIFIYLHKLIANRWQKGSFVFFYPFSYIHKKLHGPPPVKLLPEILEFAECFSVSRLSVIPTPVLRGLAGKRGVFRLQCQRGQVHQPKVTS